MNKKYYENIISSIENGAKAGSVTHTFYEVKGFEYWARHLQNTPLDLCFDDFINILPKQNIKKIGSLIYHKMDSLNKAEKKLKVAEAKKRGIPVKTVLTRFGSDELSMSDDYYNREREMNQLKDYLRAMSLHYIGRQLQSSLNEHLDDNFKEMLRHKCIEELIGIIKKGAQKNDPYVKRIKKIQKAFNLNDFETELLIFLWIFPVRGITKDIRNAYSGCNGSVSTQCVLNLFPEYEQELEAALQPNATLPRMRILHFDSDGDISLSDKVSQFLNGTQGDNIEECYYRIYKGDHVDYAQLKGERKNVDVMFEMLKHAQPGKGMNIFLYGVEGTGKTELAKSMAHELGRPLVLTNFSTRGANKQNNSDVGIYERMENILFASYKFKGYGAIILVDEADLILNGCEKGALNFFMEQVNVPTIWISNNTGFIENSTLRRFDFSIHFERLNAEKRTQIWESVVKKHKAQGLLTHEDLVEISSEIPITAGGITQAIRTAQELQKQGSTITPKEIVRQMATAQAKLIGIPREYVKKESASHAPRYSNNVLNLDCNQAEMWHVLNAYNAKWQNFTERDSADSLNMLFYGPPGTGKTEYAKYIARELGRKLIIKRVSDIQSMWVGETEKNIRAMFHEADESKAVLFLDEADSLLRSREGARNSYEVSQVNELLTQMENFKGIFIAATNFNDALDSASRRRFALKVKFNYLKAEGIAEVWNCFFPQHPCPQQILQQTMLAPGDFNAAYGTLKYMDAEALTADRIAKALLCEVQMKDGYVARRMGF